MNFFRPITDLLKENENFNRFTVFCPQNVMNWLTKVTTKLFIQRRMSSPLVKKISKLKNKMILIKSDFWNPLSKGNRIHVSLLPDQSNSSNFKPTFSEGTIKHLPIARQAKRNTGHPTPPHTHTCTGEINKALSVNLCGEKWSPWLFAEKIV